MRHHYSITVQPDTEPVTYEECAAHSRVDSESDRDYLTALIPVAREMVDGITGRASISATYKMVAPSFAVAAREGYSLANREIPLFRSPLVSVSSVKYYDADNVLQTITPETGYFIVTSTETGRVILKDDPPVTYERPDAVQIEFVAGHESPGEVTALHRHAIKMLAGHLYDERAVVAATELKEIPWQMSAIIQQLKLGGYCA